MICKSKAGGRLTATADPKAHGTIVGRWLKIWFKDYPIKMINFCTWCNDGFGSCTIFHFFYPRTTLTAIPWTPKTEYTSSAMDEVSCQRQSLAVVQVWCRSWCIPSKEAQRRVKDIVMQMQPIKRAFLLMNYAGSLFPCVANTTTIAHIIVEMIQLCLEKMFQLHFWSVLLPASTPSDYFAVFVN